MKKVLHIIDSLWLWWAQTVVKWIFEVQKDNDAIYIFAMRKREVNTNIQHDNIYSHDSWNKFSFPITELRKFIIEKKIEIIHCHLAKSQIMWAVLKKLYFPNIKLVFHEHGQIFETGKIYPILMNSFRHLVDSYIAVSKATKKEILKKTDFDEKKIHIIYNFVDLNTFKKIEDFNQKEERKKYDLPEIDYIVGFASRLVIDKWWKEFVEAAELLTNDYPEMKFIIWWDGPDKEKISKFIQENNLSKNIFLVWYIQDMVSFYNMIDCFVFPSHRESMWLTWLEANACWCPVVASDIPWLNEVMIDWKNALLFEKWNFNDLFQNLLKIQKDKHLVSQLEIQENFTSNIYFEKLNWIYES